MKVYQAINKVQAALAQDGITKDRRNEDQGWNFRGIDDVYNALAPLLAKHGLCILPRFLHRQCEERRTSKNYPIFFVTVDAEFDIVCSEDGSKHVARTYGEAMDSSDKATNKAMSAAYKYAVFQVFAIPTKGNNDADSTTPDAGTAIAKAPKQEMQSVGFPAGANPSQQVQARPEMIAPFLGVIESFLPGAHRADDCEKYWNVQIFPKAEEDLNEVELQIVKDTYDKKIVEVDAAWKKQTARNL